MKYVKAESTLSVQTSAKAKHKRLTYSVIISASASGGGLPPSNKICTPSQRAGPRFTIEEIIKIVATRCQILRLKCTNSFVGRGSAPDPAGGAYSAPPDPLVKFYGPTSKGRGEGRVG